MYVTYIQWGDLVTGAPYKSPSVSAWVTLGDKFIKHPLQLHILTLQKHPTVAPTKPEVSEAPKP